MSLRPKILRGGFVLTGGLVTAQALSFIRNIIIARILNPEDMGIAATFAITISLLEMISNLAVDMLLVQAKDGDDPVFQGTTQLFQVFRGLLVGLVIYSCAPIIIWLFKIPQAEWAFRVLALVPVFRGFMHLDWKRLQRKMQYRSTILVEVIPQAAITLAAYPMVMWLGDYSTVLWLVLIQAALGLIVSHIFSQRAYRLYWDQKCVSQIIIFGWPLLINGLLMFGALQGDRLIIGTFYSMTYLGVYSVAFSLVFILTSLFTKASTSLLLPLFSGVQDQSNQFKEYYILSVQIMALIGGLVALPLVTAGGHIIVLLFGDQYGAAFLFAPWLGLLLAVRIFRVMPTIAALAIGDTKSPMNANIFRLIGVALAFFVAWETPPLSVIVACGIGGEILALIYAILRLKKLQLLKVVDTIYPLLVVSLVIISAAANGLLTDNDVGIFESAKSYFVFCIVLLIAAIFVFSRTREEIKKFLTKLRNSSADLI